MNLLNTSRLRTVVSIREHRNTELLTRVVLGRLVQRALTQGCQGTNDWATRVRNTLFTASYRFNTMPHRGRRVIHPNFIFNGFSDYRRRLAHYIAYEIGLSRRISQIDDLPVFIERTYLESRHRTTASKGINTRLRGQSSLFRHLPVNKARSSTSPIGRQSFR